MEADIQQHVLEYLAFNNFTNTASCFEAELRKREAAGENSERPMEHLSPEKRKEVMTAFLDAFDRGDHTELFTLWQRHIPPHVRNRDPVAQKLEFYLNVHCAAMPFRPSFLKRFKGRPRGVADAAARAMQRFNHFLETRGKQLAQTTEFLVYYALPYVPNPVDHPSFQVIFRDSWASDLRTRLVRFLDVVLQTVPVPEIYAMYKASYRMLQGGGSETPGSSSPAVAPAPPASAGQASATPGAQRHHERQQRANEEGGPTERETRLLQFAESLYSVSVELFGLIQSAPEPAPIASSVLTAGARRLDEYRGALQDMRAALRQPPRQLPQVSYAAAAHPSAKQGGGPVATTAGAGAKPPVVHDQPLAPLAYASVQRDLRNFLRAVAPADGGSNPANDPDRTSAARQCCLLLQALRWRVTRTRPGPARRSVLTEFIQHDAVGCRVGGDHSLLGSLLSADSRWVIPDYACRLVNCVASEGAGRHYLLQAPDIVTRLVDLLDRERGDSPCRQNALGALQKFSLRRPPQSHMIRLGVIPWILRTLWGHLRASAGADTLDQTPLLSDYSLDYATALLMNLCLRSAGQRSAERSEVDVLATLMDLAEHDSAQVRTYVNGTLYSVLSRPKMKERALQSGTDTALSMLMEHSDDLFKRQLQYILEQLRAPPRRPGGQTREVDAAQLGEDSEAGDSGDEEDESEDNEVSEELAPGEEFVPEDADEPELVEAGDKERAGEDLLCALYLRRGGDSAAAQEAVRKRDAVAKGRAVREVPTVDAGGSGLPPNRPTTPGGTLAGSSTRTVQGQAPRPDAEEGVPGASPTATRDVPEEMQSRPRIPRTPPGSASRTRGALGLQPRSPEEGGAVAATAVRRPPVHPAQAAQGGEPAPGESEAPAAQPADTNDPEYQQVFATRNRIVRTPYEPRPPVAVDDEFPDAFRPAPKTGGRFCSHSDALYRGGT